MEINPIALGTLLLGVLVLLSGVVWVGIRYLQLRARYKGVVDVDREIASRKKQVAKLDAQIRKAEREFDEKRSALSSDYQEKRGVYEALLGEINVLQEDLEFMSFGIYKPHFDFDTSEQFKAKLTETRQRQKQIVRDKAAIVCHMEWMVEGSKREGRKMVNRSMKLMLRAFNGECDAAVLKVKWNNVAKMEERIRKAYSAINGLGETQNINITEPYLEVKVDELRLAHEYEEKRHEEKEEQQRIREQMREEELVQREIEQAKREAELEEKRHEKALEQARRELEQATGEQVKVAGQEIARLQALLDEVHEKRDRAVSRAQLTKSGHVYVISNIGSFGEGVYKIGLTRRLEPLDRVKELGDASVPFAFDVHAMIYAEDAPTLENKLHKAFDERRFNLINNRKEFFQVDLSEIESVVHSQRAEIEFTKIAEAKEYRKSIVMRSKMRDQKTLEEMAQERFPSTL